MSHPSAQTELSLSTLQPYYVRIFLSRCRLASSVQLSSVFSSLELDQLRFICTQLSNHSIALLARLQRRRRVAYFRLTEVAQRYGKEFRDLSALYQAVAELRQLRLLAHLDAHVQTCSSFNLGVQKNVNQEQKSTVDAAAGRSATYNSSQVKSHTLLDPLWALLSLSVDEIGALTAGIGGVVDDLWKRQTLRVGKKRHFVIQLYRLCCNTQTLSHQTLYSRIVNHLVESYGNFVTIPLHWKRMFQKLDVLDSAHTLDPDVFDYVGSFSLLSHSLIRQCTCIISERCLPLEYVMERSSIDNSLLVESPELSALPRATASGPPLFSCFEEYSAFEAARFVHKVVAEACSKKQYTSVFELTAPLEAVLYRFLTKKAAAIDALRRQTTAGEKEKEKCFLSKKELYEFQRQFSHPFLARFTFEWVSALTLYDIAKAYETNRNDHQRAVELLELLLDTRLIYNKRQKIFNRLTINFFVNLRQPQMALEAALNAFRDVDQHELRIPTPQMNEIAHRLLRILNACFSDVVRNKVALKHKTRRKHPDSNSEGCKTNGTLSEVPEDSAREIAQSLFCHLPRPLRSRIEVVLAHRLRNEERIPRRVIRGNAVLRESTDDKPVNKTNKAIFLSESDAVVSVERYALEWYNDPKTYLTNFAPTIPLPCEDTSRFSWVGIHDEGSLLRELFGILMADLLFDATVQDVFVLPNQTAPLDLFSETFYSSRKRNIDARLAALRAMTSEELFWETLSSCFRLCPKTIIGVTWNLLSRVLATKPGIVWWTNYRERLEKSPTWSISLNRLRLTSAFHEQKFLLPLDFRKRSWVATEQRGISSRLGYPGTYEDTCILLAALAAGIGSRVLTVVLETLSLHYCFMHSGFPDLTLWRTAATTQIFPPPLVVLFSEVKSEKDRLSEKQRQWLGILLDAGANAELFCVRKNGA